MVSVTLFILIVPLLVSEVAKVVVLKFEVKVRVDELAKVPVPVTAA